MRGALSHGDRDARRLPTSGGGSLPCLRLNTDASNGDCREWWPGGAWGEAPLPSPCASAKDAIGGPQLPAGAAALCVRACALQAVGARLDRQAGRDKGGRARRGGRGEKRKSERTYTAWFFVLVVYHTSWEVGPPHHVEKGNEGRRSKTQIDGITERLAGWGWFLCCFFSELAGTPPSPHTLTHNHRRLASAARPPTLARPLASTLADTATPRSLSATRAAAAFSSAAARTGESPPAALAPAAC